MIEAFLASVAVVALAEIGDKTMLLAIVLAARLRAPWQIMAGILVATLANHALAALAGQQIAGLLDAFWFRFAIAIGFLGMAAWIMIPDELDDEDERFKHRASAFATTLVAFFLVEIGDKTQIATVALGAHYGSVFAVTLGTTLGMMLANGPAVFLGDKLVAKISLRLTRLLAAGLFAALGLWQLAALLR